MDGDIGSRCEKNRKMMFVGIRFFVVSALLLMGSFAFSVFFLIYWFFALRPLRFSFFFFFRCLRHHLAVQKWFSAVLKYCSSILESLVLPSSHSLCFLSPSVSLFSSLSPAHLCYLLSLSLSLSLFPLAFCQNAGEPADFPDTWPYSSKQATWTSRKCQKTFFSP